MNAVDENTAKHVVARILLVSPEQNELFRRNRSRVFVHASGESIIDSMMFQSQRPIEGFIPAVERAIQLAGLRLNTDDDLRMVAMDTNLAGGGLQQHLVTNAWLSKDVGEGRQLVYDMLVEVDIRGEVLEQPNIMTSDANIIDDNVHENPLVIEIDVTNMIAPEINTGESDSESSEQQDTVQQERSNVVPMARELEAARQSQDEDGGNRARQAGKPGRVKDPLTDGRMKRNRDARQSQDTDVAQSR